MLMATYTKFNDGNFHYLHLFISQNILNTISLWWVQTITQLRDEAVRTWDALCLFVVLGNRFVAHVSLLSAGSLAGSIIFTYGAKWQCWSFIEKRNSFYWHLWCHALKLNDWNVRFVFFFKVVTPSCIMHFQVVWYQN